MRSTLPLLYPPRHRRPADRLPGPFADTGFESSPADAAHILQVGEVAGTAAALSVLTAVEPRHVDIRKLQAWLREQGVLEAESVARMRKASKRPGQLQNVM